jgi:hypothetical protein
MYSMGLTYKGLELEIDYEWDDGYAGDAYEPPRSAGMEEYQVFIVQDKNRVDITEWLSDETLEDIIAEAEGYHGVI